MYISLYVLLLFYLISLNVFLIWSHITRLPCAWHAKFLATNGKRYPGTLLKTVENLAAREMCSLRCLANVNCTFANYADTGSCELMRDTDGISVVDADGWILLKTNTSQQNNIGPLCETNKPCPDTHACRDSCEDGKNMYFCYTYPNVAGTSVVTFSIGTGGHYPETNCHDGNTGNICMIDGSLPSWIKMDLQLIFHIVKITVYDRSDCCPGRLGAVELKTSAIGDDLEDYEFLSYLSATGFQQNFECDRMMRYIILYENKLFPLGVQEIEVYAP